MNHKTFPVFVEMDGRNYEIKAINTLKTGERIAKAILHHPVLGKQEVQSPSIRLRLAHRFEQGQKEKS